MNNIEPIDTLPNSVLDKHRIHVGNFKEGDYLMGNNDGTIYKVSNLQIDKIEGLEVRLTKERMTTENEIKTVYSYVSEKNYKLKDQIEENKKDTDNRISEVWNKIHQNSNFLQDCIRENKIKIEQELESLRRTLFWISFVAFLVMGFLCFGIIFLSK